MTTNRIAAAIVAAVLALSLAACKTYPVECHADGHGNPSQQMRACADR